MSRRRPPPRPPRPGLPNGSQNRLCAGGLPDSDGKRLGVRGVPAHWQADSEPGLGVAEVHWQVTATGIHRPRPLPVPGAVLSSTGPGPGLAALPTGLAQPGPGGGSRGLEGSLFLAWQVFHPSRLCLIRPGRASDGHALMSITGMLLQVAEPRRRSQSGRLSSGPRPARAGGAGHQPECHASDS
jgi:hypothetical protein